MGNIANEILSKEHDGKSQPGILEPKRGGLYGWDTDNLAWTRLKVDSSGQVYVTGVSPGGSDTEVQFNDGGSFNGAEGLKYDKTANTITIKTGYKLIFDGA